MFECHSTLALGENIWNGSKVKFLFFLSDQYSSIRTTDVYDVGIKNTNFYYYEGCTFRTFSEIPNKFGQPHFDINRPNWSIFRDLDDYICMRCQCGIIDGTLFPLLKSLFIFGGFEAMKEYLVNQGYKSANII